MPSTNASKPRVDVYLTPADLRAALRIDADQGLRATPKDIPPKWFYDTRGSELFDDITRLPEYYPTRCERAILVARANEIAEVTGADTLVELGSGTSEKTRILLDALRDAGTIERFVPFDVSEQTLREAAAAVNRDYPAVSVHAVVGDFEHHLGSIPGGGRRLVAFLGGTIGNLEPPRRGEFLHELAQGLGPDDHLLLGLDLVKDRRTKAPDPELAQRVARECLDLGMMTSVVRGGLGVFRIAPPITIEAAEIDLGLEIFDRALARAVH